MSWGSFLSAADWRHASLKGTAGMPHETECSGTLAQMPAFAAMVECEPTVRCPAMPTCAAMVT